MAGDGVLGPTVSFRSRSGFSLFGGCADVNLSTVIVLTSCAWMLDAELKRGVPTRKKPTEMSITILRLIAGEWIRGMTSHSFELSRRHTWAKMCLVEERIPCQDKQRLCD